MVVQARCNKLLFFGLSGAVWTSPSSLHSVELLQYTWHPGPMWPNNGIPAAHIAHTVVMPVKKSTSLLSIHDCSLCCRSLQGADREGTSMCCLSVIPVCQSLRFLAMCTSLLLAASTPAAEGLPLLGSQPTCPRCVNDFAAPSSGLVSSRQLAAETCPTPHIANAQPGLCNHLCLPFRPHTC